MESKPKDTDFITYLTPTCVVAHLHNIWLSIAYPHCYKDIILGKMVLNENDVPVEKKNDRR
jgi:hypothetical protein